MSGPFDFRDMLGGASATVGHPDADLRRVLHAGSIAMLVVGKLVQERQVHGESIIGFLMSEHAAAALAQEGRGRALDILDSWESLINHLRAPGGLDRNG